MSVINTPQFEVGDWVKVTRDECFFGCGPHIKKGDRFIVGAFYERGELYATESTNLSGQAYRCSILVRDNECDQYPKPIISDYEYREPQMNDRQIEAAARKFCELRGMNPDENAFDGVGETHVARWRLSIHHVKNHLAMQQAIEYAKGIVE